MKQNSKKKKKITPKNMKKNSQENKKIYIKKNVKT